MRAPRSGKVPTAFLQGSGLALGTAALSFAAATWGFRRLYYLGILLPLGAFLALFLAWLLYLREDGLVRRGEARRARLSPTLLWTALLLALLAAFLYAFAGIGASYFF